MFSCGSNALYDKSEIIPDAKWDNENKPCFDFNIDDTLTEYAFYLNIRHLENYRYNNLYVFMSYRFPNDTIVTDTISCPLAAPDGHWLGKGSGTMRSAKILLNPNLRFPLKGDYHIEIEQAMREKVLEGITDIGICIEKQ